MVDAKRQEWLALLIYQTVAPLDFAQVEDIACGVTFGGSCHHQEKRKEADVFFHKVLLLGSIEPFVIS